MRIKDNLRDCRLLVAAFGGMVLGALALAGCSLDTPKSGASVRINFEESARRTLDLLGARSLGYGILSTPATTTDFNCFAVNLTGAGVATNGQLGVGCSSPTNFRGRGPGIISQPTARGTAIALEVPAGTARTIDVYGVFPSSSQCGGAANGSSNSGYFLGSLTTDLLAPLSVTIPISFSSGQAADVVCTNASGSSGGPVFPQFGSGADGNVTLGPSFSIDVTSDTSAIAGRTFSAQRVLTGIDATGTVFTSGASINVGTDFAVSDEIMWIVLAGNGSGCGPSDMNVGNFNFAKVTAVTGSTITVDTAISSAPGSVIATNLNASAAATNFCRVGVVRIPNIANLTLSSSVSPNSITGGANYNLTTTASALGILALRVSGTLNYASGTGSISFLASGAGFAGASNCTAGDGIAGTGTGGASGACGPKGGGGGGSTSGPGGTGGGGTSGGAGYAACTGANGPCMRLGSGGGGGGNTGTASGAGGGIAYLSFKQIVIGTHSGARGILATGGAGVSSGINTGAGGGGGTVIFSTESDPSVLSFGADGGPGGNDNGSSESGGGGAGGFLSVQACAGSNPATATVAGGLAGTSGGTVGGSGTSGVPNLNVSSTQPFCAIP